MTNWKTGPPEEFWMEDYPPNGTHHNYVFDILEEGTHEMRDLFNLLDALGILDYGTIYETVDCLRIRER